MVDFSDNSIRTIGRLNPADRPFQLVIDHRPDKSLTHRALMFAAIAQGHSKIFNPLLGEDCLTTAKVVRALGCKVSFPVDATQALEVESPGIDQWNRNPGKIDFGNSGTTARLMIGLLASVPGMRLEAAGDASLNIRPMKRVVEPLRMLGADIEYLESSGFLPIRLSGRELSPGKLSADKASAQIKSALMLAAINISGEVEIKLPSGGRDHTERLLERLAADIQVTQLAGHYELIRVRGKFRPECRDSIVPNDPSSAAFVFALPLIHGAGEVCCRAMLLNSGRTHFLNLLGRMGAEVRIENRRSHDASGMTFIEEVGDVTVRPGKGLKGIVIQAEEVPMVVDEIPILSVIASFADDPSNFCGLEELRVKESDRLAQTAELLRMAGASHRVLGDDLQIDGGLKGSNIFEFNPQGDHRLAMAAAIMMTRSISAGSAVIGGRCVDVSFPGFFDLIEQMK